LVGLWETWKGPDKTIQSCTVVTTEANSMMTEQHHHMPVMLDPQDFD
jgi:putative SOS response-associated peptidase YedK